MIEKKDIRDMEHVKSILYELANYRESYEAQFGKLTESVIDNIGFQLAEVDEYVVELYHMEDNPFDNFSRTTIYWQYIDGKVSYEQFIERLEDHLKS